MKKRVHVFYSGSVQGVGFRFTAIRIANIVGITGWIKNRADGRVEVVAEGEEGRLLQFLDKIRTGPLQYYIHNVDVNWQESRDEFKEFDIKF